MHHPGWPGCHHALRAASCNVHVLNLNQPSCGGRRHLSCHQAMQHLATSGAHRSAKQQHTMSRHDSFCIHDQVLHQLLISCHDITNTRTEMSGTVMPQPTEKLELCRLPQHSQYAHKHAAATGADRCMGHLQAGHGGLLIAGEV